MSLMTRYDDGYLVARTIDSAGQIIKGIGFVVAALIVLGGFVLASQSSAAFGFAGILVGAMTALPFYAFGVLVSAQGQILKATLDTAVNSSPLFSHDEIRQILTRSRPASVGAANVMSPPPSGAGPEPAPIPPVALQPGYSPCPKCNAVVNNESVKCWSCDTRIRAI